MLKNININRKRGKTLISALYSCIWCGLLSSSLAKLIKYVVLFFSHVPPFSPHEKNLPFASIKQHTIRFQSQFFLYAKCVLMIFVIITMHLQIMILENAAYEMENIKLYYFTENIFVEWLFVVLFSFFWTATFPPLIVPVFVFNGPPKFANLNFDFYIIWLNLRQ